ncbi:MAG TPA: MaoC family dehydratase [Chloroflexota bacterium]
MTGEPRPIEVGATASLTHLVTDEDVRSFARITRDTNPVHLDEEYARASRFGRRIAHGMLAAGYISAVLGTRLPGPGAIYLSQTLAFKAPVYLGDAITATVRVTAMRQDKPIATIATVCTKEDGTVVLEGEAVLLCPSA